MKQTTPVKHLRDDLRAQGIAIPMEQYAFMFFVPINTPSSKNSKNIVTNFKTKRPMLISNKLTQDYKKATGIVYQAEKSRFRKATEHLVKPLMVEFEFLRDSNRHFDLINAAQIVQDMMVEHELLDDDDYTNVIPYFVPPKVLKNHPGVWVRVIDTSKFKPNFKKI